jgi:hypothetical protein
MVNILAAKIPHLQMQPCRGAVGLWLEIGARTYGSVKSILESDLDRRASQRRVTNDAAILHSNIRGAR